MAKQTQSTQQVTYKKQARDSIKRGVDITVNAVKATLGPEGKNVVIEKSYYTNFTKDGVTVADNISLKDKIEAIGNKAVKEAANQTNKMGGDGTTVTSILVQAMVDQGFSALDSGNSSVSLIKGIKKAVSAVNDFLTSIATPVPTDDYKKLKDVASISANDQEMGEHIANLFHKLGKDGIIVVEEAKHPGYQEEYIQGVQIEKGMIAPQYMMTDPILYKAELDKPLILLTDDTIEQSEPIKAILEAMYKQGHRKLVVIAGDLSGKAIEVLVKNNERVVADGTRGNFQTVALRAPYAGVSSLEALEDLAALTGATVFSKAKGTTLPRKTELVDLTLLGTATKVVSDPRRTVIVGGQGKPEDIENRITKLREDIKTEEREWEKTKLKERLARLTGEIAVLRFGGENESVTKEMKYRIEDSINATRNALEEGIVPGGEVAILRASKELEKMVLSGSEARGVDIIRQALQQPIHELAANAGNVGVQVAKRILENENINYGWDAAKDEYCDMLEQGIIDPLKVVRSAVNNAATTTCVLLTTDVVITDEDQENVVE